MERALRVALLWNGTAMQEETLNLPSTSSKVTVGTSRANTFVLSGRGLEPTHTLLTRRGDGYTLELADGMTGKLHVQGEDVPVVERIGRNIHIVEGDWGSIIYHGITLFFQFVETDVTARQRGLLAGLDFTLASAVWFSFLVQATFIFVCLLLWDSSESSEELEIPARLIEWLMPAEPEEFVDIEAMEEAFDESTSAQAGGEEGEFGDEDSEFDDSILPDHDGPMVDHLDTTDLGQALDQAIAQSGALQNIFDSNTLTAGFGQDFATAGEGDAYVVGRGFGGMGNAGMGPGGGGEGFGRVRGTGSIDTGGGRGVSANLGRRGQRAPRARVERGTATVNGFLSREQIERVVRRHTRGIRYCYERELQDDPELEGEIVANWTIDLDGTVSRRSIEENSMGNRDVESCILREIGRMRFPEPDGGMVVVRYPFRFRGVTDD